MAGSRTASQRVLPGDGKLARMAAHKPRAGDDRSPSRRSLRSRRWEPVAPDGRDVSQRRMTDYDDAYATCERTYATLRLYPGPIALRDVTARLRIDPTQSQISGGGRSLQGWFLSTEGAVESRDVRRHIDWLLDRIEPSSRELEALMREGARVDVSCYWLSASGHGGPTLSPQQMGRLARLQLDCWFDVYSTG